MPSETHSELNRKRARSQKLARLRRQYSDGKKSRQDVLDKIALVSPGLSWEEFEAPIKK